MPFCLKMSSKRDIVMKKLLVALVLLFFIQVIQSQSFVSKSADSLYKEDQFYFGVTYNLLTKGTVKLSQTGFSSGFHLGFIKDMPINKSRDIAFALGLGYTINSFNQNLLISKNDLGEVSYSLLGDSDTYTQNRFSNHAIELPFEFRWRTSNTTEYNFWRIYSGFKLSYNIMNTVKHKGDDLGDFKFRDIEDFNNLQYGFTLTAGYNTWNIHLYYGLNTVFSESKINDEVIDTRVIKIGLMFYIL